MFFTCWLVYTFFWTPYIVREHFPAIALAENGSLNVERYRGWTQDIFEGPHAGAYINNNPGASLTGAIPLLVLRPLLARVDAWNQRLPRRVQKTGDDEVFQRTIDEGRAFYFLLVAFLTVALVMAPATAGTVAYLSARLIAGGISAANAACASLLYGLATPLLFRAGHLNHNLLVCDAGFAALLLLWDPHDRPLAMGRALLAGLLAGYAVLCDYSGLVVEAVTFLYAWKRSAGQAIPARRRLLLIYAAGLLPGIAALAIYQAWAFGSLYRPSQQYMPATTPTAHGYRGFDWPSPALLWANFFDPRFGLFLYCPALLLAFGVSFARRARYRIPKREAGILWLYFALFVLFCASNQYSWLQPLTGFRYLVPAVPALALLAFETAQTLPPWLRRTIAVAAYAQSLALAAAHENDVRLTAAALWHSRFALVWMIRLREAGVPVTWLWTLAAFVFLALALAIIWRRPAPLKLRAT